MTRSFRPFDSHFYPLMNPPSRNGYHLDIYRQLMPIEQTMIYEIRKPFEPTPFTFVIYNFEEHLTFFHLLWNLDEFDTCPADHHFMQRAWHHLCSGPWQPAQYEIDIALENEPTIHRCSAQVYLMNTINDEEEYGIKQIVGRFCMLPIPCRFGLDFLFTLTHDHRIFHYSKHGTRQPIKNN
jgi:hypothetical protein